MKNKTKKLMIIIAIAAIIGFSFAACDGDDNETDGSTIKQPSAGDGSFYGLTNLSIVDETNDKAGSGTINFTHARFSGGQLDTFSNRFTGETEIKIVNNKLSIKLGTPKSEDLIDVNDAFSYFNSAVTDITPGLKVLTIGVFYSDNYRLDCYLDNETPSSYEYEAIDFIYANKEGTVYYKEIYEEEGRKFTDLIDLRLKQGWNTIISFEIGEESTKLLNEVVGFVSGKPDSRHQWVLRDRPFWE